MTLSPEQVVDRIVQLHEQLSTAESLAPSPEVDQAFTELMELSRYRHGEDLNPVLDDPRIVDIQPELHRLYARGGYEREIYWSKRIHDSSDPHEELQLQPYIESYRRLMKMEYAALSGVSPTPIDRIVFAGSGALPLTTMLMAQDFGIRSRNIDICPKATELAERVVRRLGISGLEFEENDVTACTDFTANDIVILAVSVGKDTADKIRVIQSLHRQLPEGALLMVRSTQGMRTLLYPELGLSHLTGFTPLYAMHPLNSSVNSIIIAQNNAKDESEATELADLAVSAS